MTPGCARLGVASTPWNRLCFGMWPGLHSHLAPWCKQSPRLVASLLGVTGRGLSRVFGPSGRNWGLTSWPTTSIVSSMTTDAITSGEVARLLGKSRSWVKLAVANGELPTIGKLDGPTGPHLFSRSTIEHIARTRKDQNQ